MKFARQSLLGSGHLTEKNVSREYYRRRLPHYQPSDAVFFVTCRLTDSLPREVILDLMRERDERLAATRKERDQPKRKLLELNEQHLYFEAFDKYLDNVSTGSDWLRRDDVAGIVAEAIHFRDGKEFELLSFCIMPNHVHLVLSILDQGATVVGRRASSPYRLTRILESLKWYTARECNKLLGRKGAFWQHESYDHVVRDGAEQQHVIEYVVHNPVKAGLCREWKDWKWTYVKDGLLTV
ncbi:MAG: hypothetical protein FJ217_10615 [Ignavibacteria bacterium]|nr:hypothetical protein [Ignavibacteria bacterium]